MKSRTRKSLRVLAVTATAFSLAGCALNGSSDAAQVYELAKASFGIGSGTKVTLAEAAASPYASIAVAIGDSNETMLLLASDNNGQRLWTSAARIAIVTQNGRIIRTGGLPGSFSIVSPQKIEGGGMPPVTWQADFPALSRYGVAITCATRSLGTTDITILGKTIHTVQTEEVCQADKRQLDWAFSNMFWRDPQTGLAWRSIQNVNPKMASIRIDVLRPPQ